MSGALRRTRGIRRGGWSRHGGIRSEAGFGEFGEEFIGGFELTVWGGDIDVTAGGEGGDGVGVLIDDLTEEGIVIFAEDTAEPFVGDDFVEEDFADASGGDAVFEEVDGPVVPEAFGGGAFFDEFAEVFGEGCGVDELDVEIGVEFCACGVEFGADGGGIGFGAGAGIGVDGVEFAAEPSPLV